VSARLFFALDVGEEARRALAVWAASVAARDDALRPVREEQLHVTLAFLGHRPEEEVDGLASLVDAVARPVGSLSIGGALWLAPRRPHVLTAAVEGDLGQLHVALWDALEARGFERERRRFRPHVTVARVRHRTRPRTLEIADPPAVSLGAASLVLFRSWLGRGEGGTARYEALARAGV
jgi:RNA 2',3'-cyclic 3'-phosphodiesterase